MTGWKSSTFADGDFNFVFVGSPGAPDSHCGNSDGIKGKPYSTIESTPVIAEKPYIVLKGDKYYLIKPSVEKNKTGHTENWTNSGDVEIDFENVYVASETDSGAVISAKIAEGLNIVFQPGLYHLTDTIVVNRPDVVLLGLGMATLISSSGKPCIQVGDVDGVRIAGFLL